jgi:broad specificity phosphatase PhoE
MMFVDDKKKVRAFLERLAERPWQVITVAHGDAVTADCATKLREAAARL